MEPKLMNSLVIGDCTLVLSLSIEEGALASLDRVTVRGLQAVKHGSKVNGGVARISPLDGQPSIYRFLDDV
jgi:hypothetical protein